MFEDVLRRALKYLGYQVTQVMNLTDVDDKTIRASREAGIPLDDYTQRFKDAFFEDIRALNIESAEHYPAATDHLPAMIKLIEALVEKEYAYIAEDGCVYFSIEKCESYGRLVKLDPAGMRPGERVEDDEYEKEGVADFALWKAWKEEDGDVAWDSPWGRGRPGWHIECSAMSMQYLGETFDLHTGGVDNRFPHHEDEIAQSECATGKPFVRYWMHSNFLLVDGKKMSKSLGNFYTLRDLLEKGYPARAIRYLLVSAHYRQQLNFTLPGLDQAQAALGRIDEFMTRCGETATGEPGAAPDWAASGRQKFEEALKSDLNIPEALAALFGVIHDGNAAFDAGSLDGTGAAAVCEIMAQFDSVLGFVSHADEAAGADIESLVEQRQAARDEKNWAESDRLRDEIAAMGWTVKDTPDGPALRKVGTG
jgi:cysteinyl-tRNA synthetase